MNNKILFSILISFIPFYEAMTQKGTKQNGFLHIDKFFYTSGELIRYRAYFQPVLEEEKVLSIFLIKSDRRENELPDEYYRIEVSHQSIDGKLFIPDSTVSGEYLLIAHLEQTGLVFEPLFTTPIYIHNARTQSEKNRKDKTIAEASSNIMNIKLVPEGGIIIPEEDNMIGLYIPGYRNDTIDSAWIETANSKQKIEIKERYTLFNLHPESTEGNYISILTKKGDLIQRSIHCANSGLKLSLHSLGSGEVVFKISGRVDQQADYSIIIEQDTILIQSAQVTLDSGRIENTVQFQNLLDRSLYRASLKTVSGQILSQRYFYYDPQKANIHISNMKTTIPAGSGMEISGFLVNESGLPLKGTVSISVVKSEFTNPFLLAYTNNFTLDEAYHINSLFSGKAELNEKLIFYDYFHSEEASTIQIHNNGFTPGYVSGRIYKDSMAVDLGSVFMYINNPVTFFERYFSDTKGEFFFRENEIEGNYYAMILTYPKDGSNHTFSINTPIITGFQSFLERFDMSGQIQSCIDISSKLHQINQSYMFNEKVGGEDRSIMRKIDLGEPAYTIHPEEYIDFSTLPEVIREIVPHTTIRYAKDVYIMRIYDKRAENYCCRENPMIFVNNEPYFDITPIMKLPPASIEYIEVHKAMEMIKYFGEVGRNGVLNIVLKEGMSHDLPIGQSKQIFELPGIYKSELISSDEIPADYPDFREHLYWNGDLVADKQNGFNAIFKTSLLQGKYKATITGQTENGDVVMEIFEFTTTFQ